MAAFVKVFAITLLVAVVSSAPLEDVKSSSSNVPTITTYDAAEHKPLHSGHFDVPVPASKQTDQSHDKPLLSRPSPINPEVISDPLPKTKDATPIKSRDTSDWSKKETEALKHEDNPLTKPAPVATDAKVKSDSVKSGIFATPAVVDSHDKTASVVAASDKTPSGKTGAQTRQSRSAENKPSPAAVAKPSVPVKPDAPVATPAKSDKVQTRPSTNEQKKPVATPYSRQSQKPALPAVAASQPKDQIRPKRDVSTDSKTSSTDSHKKKDDKNTDSSSEESTEDSSSGPHILFPVPVDQVLKDKIPPISKTDPTEPLKDTTQQSKQPEKVVASGADKY